MSRTAEEWGRIEAADGHIHCPTCGLEQPDTAPVEAPEDAGGDGCGQCFTCLDRPDLGLRNPTSQRMVLCPECGNKRGPQATHHGHDCTGSNRPGQPGSRYGGRPSQPPANLGRACIAAAEALGRWPGGEG